MRDCSHAVPGVRIYGSAMTPVVSLTVIVQLGWNTQLTAGALTSTTVSGCAASGVDIAAAARIAITVLSIKAPSRLVAACRAAAARGQPAPLPAATQGCPPGSGAGSHAPTTPPCGRGQNNT